jgi:hypothetical protein
VPALKTRKRILLLMARTACIALLAMGISVNTIAPSRASEVPGLALSTCAQPLSGTTNSILLFGTFTNASGKGAYPIVGTELWRTLRLSITNSAGVVEVARAPTIARSSTTGLSVSEITSRRPVLVKANSTMQLGSSPASLRSWGYGYLQPGAYKVVGSLRVFVGSTLTEITATATTIEITR